MQQQQLWMLGLDFLVGTALPAPTAFAQVSSNDRGNWFAVSGA